MGCGRVWGEPSFPGHPLREAACCLWPSHGRTKACLAMQSASSMTVSQGHEAEVPAEGSSAPGALSTHVLSTSRANLLGQLRIWVKLCGLKFMNKKSPETPTRATGNRTGVGGRGQNFHWSLSSALLETHDKLIRGSSFRGDAETPNKKYAGKKAGKKDLRGHGI